MRVPRLLFSLLVGIGGAGCESHPSFAPPVDDRPIDGEWPVAGAAEVGLDAARLEGLRTKLRGGGYPEMYSFLIVRHGRLVFEEYFGERSVSELHSMQSVSKSVASLLVGIALEQGALRSVDQPVIELFPDYDMGDAGEWKRSLTVEDLQQPEVQDFGRGVESAVVHYGEPQRFQGRDRRLFF